MALSASLFMDDDEEIEVTRLSSGDAVIGIGRRFDLFITTAHDITRLREALDRAESIMADGQ